MLHDDAAFMACTLAPCTVLRLPRPFCLSEHYVTPSAACNTTVALHTECWDLVNLYVAAVAMPAPLQDPAWHNMAMPAMQRNTQHAGQHCYSMSQATAAQGSHAVWRVSSFADWLLLHTHVVQDVGLEVVAVSSSSDDQQTDTIAQLRLSIASQERP